ncbi:MAG: hypothetical protein ACW98I_15975 [Candidatus Hodarchaeales archaeon]|jgi:hypothetical protein
MTENEQVATADFKLTYQSLNVLNVIIALLIPTAIGYLSIVLITNVFTFISRELWSISVIWPELLYTGGLLGGILGGLLAIIEVALFHYKNYTIIPGESVPSDLYYIGVLAVFTFILEFFSESLVVQVILFLLELGFFAVLGWNMSKLSLETRISPKPRIVTSTEISSIKESALESPETE